MYTENIIFFIFTKSQRNFSDYFKRMTVLCIDIFYQSRAIVLLILYVLTYYVEYNEIVAGRRILKVLPAPVLATI